ncbi:MAG: acetate/propionate family kinase [Candidatus Eisenbacteria bacterium]|uniref:Acetate kinase n=1 Tax=Eiseniibacteriota bacterium TaxID=2212470 RepID=A0A538U7D3_UNCEI|nr:MAG: acetate/propionate family kinase [Candidatus Eisenbacteria bacterium]
MRILALNAGSSSLKWTLLDGASRATLQSSNEAWRGADLAARESQVREVVRAAPAFDVAGHRLVYGDVRFGIATEVGPDQRAALEIMAELDPTHIRPALDGIDAVRAAFPSTPQFAAFDTAFHATMPEAAAGYALPSEWSRQFGLRRYGFHGLSVAHAVKRARALLGGLPRRLIVFHLGSGCSVTAVEDGRSVDTTMGFTPLEGVMMGTRSGSVDPGLVLHLILRRGLSPDEVLDGLLHRSGLLGVSGVSGDVREVLAAARAGSAPARLAFDRFAWSLRRAAGAMCAALGGVDAVVFTGGIGENSREVRGETANGLAFAGLALDEDATPSGAEDRVISARDSRVHALVVRAREDLALLDQVLRLLDARRSAGDELFAAE